MFKIRTVDEVEPDEWRFSIMKIMQKEDLSVDKQQNQNFKRIAPWYTIIDGNLYRRSLSKPLLHYLKARDADYVIRKMHEGICENHSRVRTLDQKVIRARFFWPTMQANAEDIAQ